MSASKSQKRSRALVRSGAWLEELEAAQLCAVRWWQDTPEEDAPEFRADALRIAMVLSKVIASERGHSSNCDSPPTRSITHR